MSRSSPPSECVLDFAKRRRNGRRTDTLLSSTPGSSIVCYLWDDDLLLPVHAAEMLELLEDAGFAHSAPLYGMLDEPFRYGLIDLARPEFDALLLCGM